MIFPCPGSPTHSTSRLRAWRALGPAPASGAGGFHGRPPGWEAPHELPGADFASKTCGFWCGWGLQHGGIEWYDVHHPRWSRWGFQEQHLSFTARNTDQNGGFSVAKNREQRQNKRTTKRLKYLKFSCQQILKFRTLIWNIKSGFVSPPGSSRHASTFSPATSDQMKINYCIMHTKLSIK